MNVFRVVADFGLSDVFRQNPAASELWSLGVLEDRFVNANGQFPTGLREGIGYES